MTIDSAPPTVHLRRPQRLARSSLLPRRAGRGGGPRCSLAGAAQLITISALVGADPIPATWSSLLLAVAPAPLAAAAAFAPAPVNLLAAVGRDRGPGRGIAAQVTHTGLFFVPALVVLAVGAVKLWREQALSAGEGVSR